MNEIVVEILLIMIIYNYVWINWYRMHFMSRVKSIFHPYANIDYWNFTIVKDKNKISTKFNFREKLKNFISWKIKKD